MWIIVVFHRSFWLRCFWPLSDQIGNRLKVIYSWYIIVHLTLFCIVDKLTPYTNRLCIDKEYEIFLSNLLTKSNVLFFTEIDMKFPQMTIHFLARVKATFRRCGLARKPIPVVRVVHSIMISFSWPWLESIVPTGIRYSASVFEFL